MLILSRNAGQRIIIGSGPRRIVITLVSIDRNVVRIGLEAPNDVVILREELVIAEEEKRKQKEESSE